MDDRNIIKIVEKICNNLHIDSTNLIKIINSKIPENNRIITDQALLEKINLLLISDNDIQNFSSRITNQEVIKNFEIMKNQLGELQVLTIMKKLEKADTCDKILNSFLGVLNHKIAGVNDVLKESLVQTGGNVNYYFKYLKYKMKNEALMKMYI